jgi:hypothetical protein
MGKPERKRLTGRPSGICVLDTEMNQVQDGEGAHWINLAQHRYECRAIMNTVTNLRAP